MEAQLKTPLKLSAAIQRAMADIRAIDDGRRQQAQKHLDCLTKPLGSLGQLEAVAAQYVAWREEDVPRIAGKAVYVFAADHGITDEGVSAAYSRPTGGRNEPAKFEWPALLRKLDRIDPSYKQ